MGRVTLEKVSVSFPVMTSRAQSLRLSLVRFGSAGRLAKDGRGYVSISALRDVDLEAESGDRIALVGRNGSGKSTLLKLLTGIYAPTSGRVAVRGTVSAILGMGLNFDDELTGVEAVRYACLMRGMGRPQIAEIQEDVAEFTELGDYLHMPLRTYSAGMRMRLAFAVATSGAPDILLLDEGIGAGDQFFLERVQRRADEFIHSASLLFLASHSEALLRDVCNKALLLDRGQIMAAGTPEEIFAVYAGFGRDAATYPMVSIGQPSGAAEPGADATPGLGVEAFASASAEDHPPLSAVDGCPTSHWRTRDGEPVAGHAHLGLAFERPVHARAAFVRQWSDRFSGDSCVGRVAVEVSNDGFVGDVRRAGEAELPASSRRCAIALGDVGAGRWWRLIALTEPSRPGAPWAVAEFDLSPHPLLGRQKGRALAGSLAEPAVAPHCAFNAAVSTPWVSSESGAEVEGSAWIGWDYGADRQIAVRGVALAQWDDGEKPNTVAAALLQCSDDGFAADVRTVMELDLDGGTAAKRFAVEGGHAARFWRLIAHAPTGGGHWGIAHLSFRTDADGDGHGDAEPACQLESVTM